MSTFLIKLLPSDIKNSVQREILVVLHANQDKVSIGRETVAYLFTSVS